MSAERQVRDHFHADAARFDAIYEERRGPVGRFVDHVWRGVVRRRLQLTLERLEPIAGARILDVGCGSGRYGLALAARGAAHVLGIDFAPAMIELARTLAARAGVQDRCEFRVGAFPADVPETGFDAAIAMGFFDYVADPAPMVAAMRARTRRTMVMSFPKAHEWRVPVRRLRFRLLRCPLYLYTDARVREVLAAAGVTDYDWIALDRDVIIVARP
ncbi:MAG TPA: methyltransferase domain-containing protein [Candidatus Eisenbacteria bacterium]|nr:methyltransferase domain-containing protein [Candidatus Eisenbacteria bacterium]